MWTGRRGDVPDAPELERARPKGRAYNAVERTCFYLIRFTISAANPAVVSGPAIHAPVMSAPPTSSPITPT